jgi:hypothetical protein
VERDIARAEPQLHKAKINGGNGNGNGTGAGREFGAGVHGNVTGTGREFGAGVQSGIIKGRKDSASLKDAATE